MNNVSRVCFSTPPSSNPSSIKQRIRKKFSTGSNPEQKGIISKIKNIFKKDKSKTETIKKVDFEEKKVIKMDAKKQEQIKRIMTKQGLSKYEKMVSESVQTNDSKAQEGSKRRPSLVSMSRASMSRLEGPSFSLDEIDMEREDSRDYSISETPETSLRLDKIQSAWIRDALDKK